MFPQRSKIFEWNLNTVITLTSMMAGLVVTSVGWGITYANMRNDSANLRKQISDVVIRMDKDGADRKSQLADVQQQLAQIAPLTF
ncbi:hypothetical protein GA0061102_107413 [Rhizobium miluonense]|uniref:Uncharacterized protein n=2 Tax=Rhizobium miluonense TaxID=411945 RepID=A0A1C3XB49_9HYPH|nr:hypothetical protein GA0061102_107413 [Rhizobium miluonense]